MKKPPNSYIKMSSKLVLDPEVANWVKRDMGTNYKGYRNIPSRATEFYHWYCVYKRGFLINLIENHYDEIKKLLRKIGRIKVRNG